ncbi:hypothetical protein P8452_01114 [Trifolium repens]|nr:hypothetical protein P8452_01114 [Trifolium repens]
MTKYSASLVIFLIIIVLIQSNAEDPTTTSRTWCIAKPSDDPSSLARTIKSYCYPDGEPLCPITNGTDCYEPNTLYNHASFASNYQYNKNIDLDYACSLGLIVLTNPSYGRNCTYSIPPNGGEGVINLSDKKFCVPKPSASEQELISNIEYTCAQLGNCNRINPDGPCYFPNTTLNHASVVMDMYYAFNGRTDSSCNFSNSGIISHTDPSYGNCIFV